MQWGRKWQPTPVVLPGESQGQRSLVGCRLWGRTELDTTEVMQQQQQPANAEDKRDASTILGQEDPLDEEMATHSSILAWRIP